MTTVTTSTTQVNVNVATPGTQRSGVDGLSYARIYRIFMSAPLSNDTPTGGVFTNGVLTTPPTGWSTAPIASSDPVYFSQGYARGSAQQGTWSLPIRTSVGGGSGGGGGTDGLDGNDGVSIVQIRRRSVNAPDTPTGGAFSGGLVTTFPAGWGLTGGIGTAPVWESIVAVRGNQIVTSPAEWSTPIRITGQTGQTGATGAAGATGAPGAMGGTGPAGQDGATGTRGVDGRNGTDGNNGQDGAQGEQGMTGPQGPQGSVGPKGDMGDMGNAGQNGVSRVFARIRSAAEPSTPTGGVFANGLATSYPSGWTQTGGSGDNRLWESSILVRDATPIGSWTAPVGLTTTSSGGTPSTAPAITAFSIQGISSQNSSPVTLTGNRQFLYTVSNSDEVSGGLTLEQDGTVLNRSISAGNLSITLTLATTVVQAGQSVTFTLRGTSRAGATFSRSFTVQVRHPREFVYFGYIAPGAALSSYMPQDTTRALIANDEANFRLPLTGAAGNRVIILSSASRPALSHITIGGINQIAAFTRAANAVTISGQAFDAFTSGNISSDGASTVQNTMVSVG